MHNCTSSHSIRRLVQLEKPIVTIQGSHLQPACQRGIHILVVESEEALSELLCLSLQASGYLVTTVGDAEDAQAKLLTQPFDLVVLDTMLPTIDGFTFCAELRQWSNIPIVMLSALSRSEDIVRGFRVGADDYICKPFTFREVDVRIQAILRRTASATKLLVVKNKPLPEIVLNDELRQVKVHNKLVRLTRIECQLLRYLMSVPNCAVSKNELLQRVWDYELAGGINLVEVAIRRLRLKIEEDPSAPTYLVTVRGMGYKFNTQPQ